MVDRRLLLHNGRVHALDPLHPEASWVLLDRGIVRGIGRGEPVVSSDVPRIDLHGRALIPAFCDAHVHLTWIATSFLGPDLTNSDGIDAVLSELAAWRGPGRGPRCDWIVGDGFDESTWKERRLPSRQELDEVESKRPVLLKRVCGHIGVLNSAALAELSPGPYTEVGSGRVAESDLWGINDRLRPAPEQLAEVLPRVTRMLHAHGITSVHDVTSAEMLRALQQERNAGNLRLRVSCSLPAEHLGALVQCGVQQDLGDPLLRLLGVKIFVDGSLGAHTAYLREPYTDQPDTRGVALYEPGALKELTQRGHDAGLQLMVHAIGDAALELALEALEPLCVDGNPLRHRLEHVEVTPPDLVERLARSGAHACVQPNFAGRWSQPGGMNEQRLGPRLAHCNAYQSLGSAGVPLAFGSDCMPLGPLYGLQSAVQHPLEKERLDAMTALALYTAAAAEVVFAEGVHGRIAEGMAGDLVILSGDPTLASPGDLQVDATFLAGERVYERVEGDSRAC